MTEFLQTQPVPNPLSYYLHQSPEFIHWAETAGNHFVELVAPFFILLNRRLVIVGGCIQVLFQVVIIISGNLSFLNWLTIIPALACFDDRSIAWMFSSKQGSVKRQVAAIQQQERSDGKTRLRWGTFAALPVTNITKLCCYGCRRWKILFCCRLLISTQL